MSVLRTFYIIADAETGYRHGTRTYESEASARRAAQRAADASGQGVAYGLAGGSGAAGYTIKVQSGVAMPRKTGG